MSKWWISTLVAFAVIAIIVAVIVEQVHTDDEDEVDGPAQPQRNPKRRNNR